ncbi:hypothetical protein BD324DRAFT_494790 [Kockovaella imperatae]|uniref:Zn(2)-C6 fungal-type domain-containing protein n=1 Tax=Kockovaella imperatae TaxID=4999 RepID=A0A1Y1UEI3_9TREE|nr:hypothetical protein BD324DRAFT_494790 [Kockovaella imperatae]ORX36399.1 hypothetical protein BD324DRAFT_494790 [Kockovaella imperatae]
MPAPRSTCEPCHRRRVKCDLPDQISGECSNCVKRGIKCPGLRVAGPRKPRKGTVVDQIQRDFGSIEVLNGDSTSPEAGPSNYASHSSSPAPWALTSGAQWAMASPPTPTSTENSLATIELSGELAMSMILNFNISHG